MQLIVLYGPPAVGKYTVGQAVAERTGFKLFYNHLTVPAARAIFPDFTHEDVRPFYSTALKRMRLGAIRTAVEAGTDLIFTSVYNGAADRAFIQDIVDAVAAGSGHTCFVQLTAPDEVILQRVTDPSRAALGMGKPTDPVHLAHLLKTQDMHQPVVHPGILELDTHLLAPDEAAEQIIARFRLRK